MVSERAKVHIGLVAAVIVLIVCVALLVAGAMFRDNLRAALPGSIAPDFALRDAENNPVELADLRGNVVIVYFHGRGGGNTAANAACPTSLPSDSFTAADSTLTPETRASAGVRTNAVQTPATATHVSELSAMCRELHLPPVKFLDLENSLSLVNADTPANAGADSRIQTLIDSTGDVAREYEIDQADLKPTFVVIDASGVIRFRGNTLASIGAASANSPSLAPATQPSSRQILHTLLSAGAVSAALPSSGHL